MITIFGYLHTSTLKDIRKVTKSKQTSVSQIMWWSYLTNQWQLEHSKYGTTQKHLPEVSMNLSWRWMATRFTEAMQSKLLRFLVNRDNKIGLLRSYSKKTLATPILWASSSISIHTRGRVSLYWTKESRWVKTRSQEQTKSSSLMSSKGHRPKL